MMIYVGMFLEHASASITNGEFAYTTVTGEPGHEHGGGSPGVMVDGKEVKVKEAWQKCDLNCLLVPYFMSTCRMGTYTMSRICPLMWGEVSFRK